MSDNAILNSEHFFPSKFSRFLVIIFTILKVPYLLKKSFHCKIPLFNTYVLLWPVSTNKNHSLLLSKDTPMNFRNWERNEENLENSHMLKIDFKERINFRVFPSQTTQNMNEKHEKPTSHHEYTYIYILHFWHSAIMQ